MVKRKRSPNDRDTNSHDPPDDVEDHSNGGIRQPDPDDLLHGISRSPIMSSTTINFYSAYDPNFGAKVQARMRFRDERAPIVQKIRDFKYGEEVAKQWLYTPVGIREEYWEEQDKLVQQYYEDGSNSEGFIPVKVQKKKRRSNEPGSNGTDTSRTTSEGINEKEQGASEGAGGAEDGDDASNISINTSKAPA